MHHPAMFYESVIQRDSEITKFVFRNSKFKKDIENSKNTILVYTAFVDFGRFPEYRKAEI